MKLNKLALAAACASVLVGSAKATDYYLYGSTAYRKATFTAIQTLFTSNGDTLSDAWSNGGTGGTYRNCAADAPFANGDSAWVVTGNLTHEGLGTVTVHGTWAGSVGGLARLTHNDTLANTFITDVGAVAGGAVTYMPAHSPDFAMCDNQPDVTPFVAPTPGYSAVKNIPIAVVDFVIAANAGAFPANFKNVSKWQLQSLYKVGCAPMGLFTGNPADNTNGIYAVGRDDDSGTRTIFETDTGLGVGATLAQYGVTLSPSPYAFTNMPTTGINFPNDGAGYSSGGNVKSALQSSNPGNYSKGDVFNLYNSVTVESASYAIGYLAVSDWNGSGLSTLSYNGVAFAPSTSVPASNDPVIEGQYSYWGIENANVRSSDYSGNVNGIATFANALTADQFALAGNSSNPGTILVSALDCTRNDDGAVITHN